MTKISDSYLLDSFGSVIWRKHRQWEVQRKPYKAALDFSFYEESRTSATASSGDYSPAEGQWNCGQFDYSNVRNAAYSDLTNQLGATATWANNLLEARGSLSMVAGRVMQLTRFSNKLRKGDIFGAARELKTPVPKNVKSGKAKSFADQWLEYHFGWEPMVQDVGAAMNVMQSEDFGGKKLFAHASAPYRENTYYSNSGGYTRNEESGTLFVRMGAYARVSNPNAFLANRMGFVNPLSVAWEAVPFSFVFDWFANVGQILSSFSDFVGVDITFPYTTTFQRGGRNYITVIYPQPWDPAGLTRSFSSTCARCGRQPNISGPVLKVKPFKGFSCSRGATAISLLLQSMH